MPQNHPQSLTIYHDFVSLQAQIVAWNGVYDAPGPPREVHYLAYRPIDIEKRMRSDDVGKILEMLAITSIQHQNP